MQEFSALAAATALVYTVASLVKNLSAKAWRQTVTQLVVWGVGIAVMLLLRASDFGASIVIGGLVLAKVNAYSAALIGLSLGSLAMAGYDTKSALDSSDSAKQPPLGGTPPTP